ncbi:MAG: OmpA family protein [Candidatus Anammoxibacter sp.]
MRKTYLISSFVIIMSMVILSGCKQLGIREAFTPYNLDAEFQSGNYDTKIDNFVIILDASSSMELTYRGNVNNGSSRFVVAKDILMRMNSTMPALNVKFAFVTFGHDIFKPFKKTDIVYGLTNYSQAALDDALNNTRSPEGNSPGGVAIKNVKDILKTTSGRNAVIFVSDGEKLSNSPITQVRKLKNMFGDRTCFYSIFVGNKAEGKKLLRNLTKEMECGISVTVDDIASSKDMSDFVKEVFLAKRKRYDSDGDGVYDDEDQCPDTPEGAIVDFRGCWVVKGVKFEYKKWGIKPDFNSNLDNIVDILVINPNLSIRIEGHTDNIGSKKYNIGLSEKRAKAVKDYLVKMDIDASRITTKGLWFSQPISTNSTDEGRALNRRAELVPVK